MTWVDNCAGQKKNWSIFSMLVHCANKENWPFETVTLKCFEPGHTLKFKAADSMHSAIEKKMKQKGKLYYFEDFSDCVPSANCIVKEMNPEDFPDWK